MTVERRIKRVFSTPEQRQARHKLSEEFLDEVILAHIRSGELMSVEEIPTLYRTFREQKSDLGADFCLANVLVIATERNWLNECRMEHRQPLSEDASELLIAQFLLEQIALDPKMTE